MTKQDLIDILKNFPDDMDLMAIGELKTKTKRESNEVYFDIYNVVKVDFVDGILTLTLFEIEQ